MEISDDSEDDFLTKNMKQQKNTQMRKSRLHSNNKKIAIDIPDFLKNSDDEDEKPKLSFLKKKPVSTAVNDNDVNSVNHNEHDKNSSPDLPKWLQQNNEKNEGQNHSSSSHATPTGERRMQHQKERKGSKGLFPWEKDVTTDEDKSDIEGDKSPPRPVPRRQKSNEISDADLSSPSPRPRSRSTHIHNESTNNKPPVPHSRQGSRRSSADAPKVTSSHPGTMPSATGNRRRASHSASSSTDTEDTSGRRASGQNPVLTPPPRHTKRRGRRSSGEVGDIFTTSNAASGQPAQTATHTTGRRSSTPKLISRTGVGKDADEEEHELEPKQQAHPRLIARSSVCMPDEEQKRQKADQQLRTQLDKGDKKSTSVADQQGSKQAVPKGPKNKKPSGMTAKSKIDFGRTPKVPTDVRSILEVDRTKISGDGDKDDTARSVQAAEFISSAARHRRKSSLGTIIGDVARRNLEKENEAHRNGSLKKNARKGRPEPQSHYSTLAILQSMAKSEGDLDKADFNSTASIRDLVFKAWYVNKAKAERERLVEERERRRQESEKKRTIEEQKRLRALTAFMGWKDKKKANMLQRTMEKRQEDRKKEEETAEKEEKLKEAELAFRIWCEKKTPVLKEKQRERKKQEKIKSQSESELKKEKIKEAEVTYTSWERKKRELLEAKKQEEEREKQRKERHLLGAKQGKERAARQAYREWLHNKDSEMLRTKSYGRLTRRHSVDGYVPPWNPVGRGQAKH